MRFHIAALSLCLLSLTACGLADRPGTADSGVTGSLADQRESLRRRCLTEAARDLDEAARRSPSLGHALRDSAQSTETTHLRALCRELAEPPLSVQAGDAPSVSNWSIAMTGKCQAEVTEHSPDSNSGRPAHLEKYNNICKEIISSYDVVNK